MKSQYCRGLVVFAAAAGLGAAQSWPQWALNPQHTGQAAVAGQRLNRILADLIYDPLVPAEMAAQGTDLLAHYQVPLIDNASTIFMEFKSGTYNKNRYDTQNWGENGFQWQNGQLTQVWSFTSDWKAVGSQADFWEPVFHAVLANGYIYLPGAGGTLFKLRKTDGAVVSRINPFSTIDPTIFVAGVPTVDTAGNIYYNVVQQFNSGTGVSFYAHDIVDSWLVKVSPSDATAKVSYSVLTSVTAANSQPAPQPNDQCLDVFSVKQLPWPPSPDAIPPTVTCGHMRPGLNVAPAIASDGTIYTITRTQLGDGTSRYGGMAAVKPDLSPLWWTSFRDRLNDGCNNDAGTFAGALLPANGTPGGCRLGTTPGVDPPKTQSPAPVCWTTPLRRRRSHPTERSCTAPIRAMTSLAATSSDSTRAANSWLPIRSDGTRLPPFISTEAHTRSSSRTTNTAAGRNSVRTATWTASVRPGRMAHFSSPNSIRT